ncbi:hypothetical protein DFP72DRAFT_1072185 [Ephemerocybe angulata]|uniref:Uncharacterized protein n=1 Tax=Ephemerocybe angulata TaxID=980116 RepID=A0A8H6HQF5_9AGAR|nr:hypothetical protein DFP72DRAFT_1072185 [Tulosesus angulatus]
MSISSRGSPPFLGVPNEILVRILKGASLHDLQAFTHATGLPSVVQFVLKERLRLLLSLWGLDDLASRNMMRTTGSVLGGSAALSMIHPNTLVPCNLDFYCPLGNAGLVLDFFKARGYHDLSFGGRDPVSPGMGVKRVYTLGSLETLQGVNVVESLSLSPLVPILYSPTTLVMNYVSSEAVVCCYPALTTAKKGILNSPPCSMLTGGASARNIAMFAWRGCIDKYRKLYAFDVQCKQQCDSSTCDHLVGRTCLLAERRASDTYHLRVGFGDVVPLNVGPDVRWVQINEVEPVGGNDDDPYVPGVSWPRYPVFTLIVVVDGKERERFFGKKLYPGDFWYDAVENALGS